MLLGFVGTVGALGASAACDPDERDAEFRLATEEEPWGDELGDSGEPPPTDPPPPPPIDHGVPCENPSTVFLNVGGQHCSGVMIAPDVMLSAGHCVRNGAEMRDLASMSVGLGAAVCGHGSTKVEQVFVHPDFSNVREPNGEVRRPAAGDLAVVRLSGPVPGATVATLGDAIPGAPSAAVTMTGFAGGQQRCANATVIATQFIQVSETSSQPVHVVQGDLNPDGTRANACVGDSGGPVYRRGTNVVVGINSQGETVVPGLPPGTVGGPTPTTCSGNLFAAVDWAWVHSTLATGAGGVTNTCTAGANEFCLGPGDTCGAAVICGRMTCADDGTWGACTRTIDTVRDENQLDLCGGVDDDCDGTIDEDCVPDTGDGGEPCPAGQLRDPATNLCTCSGSCSFGAQMNPGTCQCETTCGDWICADTETWTCPEDCGTTCGDAFCSWMESEASCPEDCGGGSSCICGWDCPPNDPACAGVCGDGLCDLVTENGMTCPVDCGGGGGGGDYDMCSDWDFWDWYIEMVGIDEGVAAYDSMCAM